MGNQPPKPEPKEKESSPQTTTNETRSPKSPSLMVGNMEELTEKRENDEQTEFVSSADDNGKTASDDAVSTDDDETASIQNEDLKDRCKESRVSSWTLFRSKATNDNASVASTTILENDTENIVGNEEKEFISYLSKVVVLFRPEWIAFGFVIFLMIIIEATNVYIPLMIASGYETLVDTNADYSFDQRMSNISSIFVWILIVHCAGCVVSYVRASLMLIMSERVVARLRRTLYGKLLRQEIAFFDEHKTGELASRIASDTSTLQHTTSQALPEVVLSSVKLVICSAAMLWISPQLAGVTVGCTVVSFVIGWFLAKWMGQVNAEYYYLFGMAQGRVTEALTAIRMVQSFAAEEKEEARFGKLIGEPDTWWPRYKAKNATEVEATTYDISIANALVKSTFYTFIFFSGFGSVYISLWYGFKCVTDGSLTLGELASFQAFMVQIGATVVHLSRFVSIVMESRGAADRVFYILDRVPLVPIPPGTNSDDSYTPRKTPLKPKTIKGAIAVKNVVFSYPSRPDVTVFNGLSLDIPPNSTVALVGPSGAGKSTLVSLLQRFYDVKSGSIRVDDNDIRDVDLKWLRSNMGFVQQEPQLFDMSVRDNICYGVEREVSQEELEEVSRRANAHTFISKWPDGYWTWVGEHGVNLSVGQKQRIAIARALLVNPRMLLLDEPTSALDAESEHLVQAAIEKAVVGRTVVIIAHRLSTIQRADKIVVVDNHQIVGMGTHKELLQKCAKYQELIKHQSFLGGKKED